MKRNITIVVAPVTSCSGTIACNTKGSRSCELILIITHTSLHDDYIIVIMIAIHMYVYTRFVGRSAAERLSTVVAKSWSVAEINMQV